MKKIICIILILLFCLASLAQGNESENINDADKNGEILEGGDAPSNNDESIIEDKTDIEVESRPDKEVIESTDNDVNTDIETEEKIDSDLFGAIDNIEDNKNDKEENVIVSQKLKKLFGRIIYIDKDILILKNRDIEYTVYLDDYTGDELEICQIVNIYYVFEKTNILLQKYEIIKPSTCYVK